MRADIACSSDVALLAFLVHKLARRNTKRPQVVQIPVSPGSRAVAQAGKGCRSGRLDNKDLKSR